MVNISKVIHWVTICGIIVHAKHNLTNANDTQDHVNQLRHPLLSGDHAGFPVKLNVNSKDNPCAYIQCKLKGKETEPRYSYKFKTQAGFALTQVTDGKHVLWQSPYFHAKQVTMLVLQGNRYLKIDVYLTDKPVEFIYYIEEQERWKRVTKKEYIVQTTQRQVQDIIDADARRLTLAQKFKVVTSSVGCSYTAAFKPKFNHVITQVTFGQRTLWTFDPDNPVQCIRVDRINSKGTKLVKLHLIEQNESYRTIILFGNGPRSMSFKAYIKLLQEMDKLPVLNLPNKEIPFKIINQSTQMGDDDNESMERYVIKIIEDGEVTQYLNEKVSVPEMWIKDGETVKWEALHDHLDGFITWDIFKTSDNPHMLMDMVKGEGDATRIIYSPNNTGYLIGTIVDKNQKVFKDPKLATYIAVIERIEGINILQLYTTAMDGLEKCHYLLKPSGSPWRKSSRSEYIVLRGITMHARAVELDDVNASSKHVIITERKNTKDKNVPINAMTVVPKFNVLINEVLYKGKEIWVYSKRHGHMLLGIKRWTYDGADLLALEMVDIHDRRQEILYQLKQDEWEKTAEAPLVKRFKYPVRVDIKKSKVEGMIYEKARQTFKYTYCQLEPMEGYYIEQVVSGNIVIWASGVNDYSCAKIYWIQIQGFRLLYLKLYDRIGKIQHAYYVDNGQDREYVEIDIILTNFLARHLKGGTDFAKVIIQNKFPSAEFFNSLVINTETNAGKHEKANGSLAPKILPLQN